MKTLFFTCIFGIGFLITNAQTVKMEKTAKTVSTEQFINVQPTNKSNSKIEITSNKFKTKKHFIRKMVANLQGVDLKNAWSSLSMN